MSTAENIGTLPILSHLRKNRGSVPIFNDVKDDMLTVEIPVDVKQSRGVGSLQESGDAAGRCDVEISGILDIIEIGGRP
jgi:hypothetical protein